MFRIFKVCIVIGTGVLFQCVNPFSPRVEKEIEGAPFITEQASPEELFQNFRYAYTFRDSLLYADLLDSAFVFEFFDPSLGTSGAFDVWGKEVELKTTGRLLAIFSSIELIWMKIFFESDAENGSKKIFRDFRLRLTNSETNITVQGAALFTLVKNTDGKWRIRRWIDESNL